MRGTGLLGVVAVGLLSVATLTARPSSSASAAVSDAEARAAATRAIALLQQSMTTWESKRSCASCHHQHLPVSLLRTRATARGVLRRRGGAADRRAPGPAGVEPGLRRPGGDAGRPVGRLGLVAGLAGRHRRQAHARRPGLRPPNPDPSTTRWSLEHHRRPPTAVLQRRHGDGRRRTCDPAIPAGHRWNVEGRAATDRARVWLQKVAPGGYRRAHAAASGPVVDRGRARRPRAARTCAGGRAARRWRLGAAATAG